MTLDEFAATTQRVISDQSFEDFLPTACYPARCHLVTLAGVPKEGVPETHILEWASRNAVAGEEFVVAFKVDGRHFKIIRRIGLYSEDEIYAVI